MVTAGEHLGPNSGEKPEPPGEVRSERRAALRHEGGRERIGERGTEKTKWEVQLRL